MGFLDIFGGGTPAQKAQKLKAKVTQKYGDPAVRQKAIQQVAQLRVPEAVTPPEDESGPVSPAAPR